MVIIENPMTWMMTGGTVFQENSIFDYGLWMFMVDRSVVHGSYNLLRTGGPHFNEQTNLFCLHVSISHEMKLALQHTEKVALSD